EDAPVQHGHFAAAALAAGVVGALPGLPFEVPGGTVAMRSLYLALQRLEPGADLVAQLPEPGAGRCLADLDVGGQCHVSAANPCVCRSASPSTRVAAIATLSERMPLRMGMRTASWAAAATASGTPAV